VFNDLAARGDEDVARLDWEIAGAQDAFLDFSVLDTGAENFGDDLIYRADGSARSIEYVDASAGETWDIRWDVASGEGSLMVPGYNGGARACWDAQQMDAACPPAAPRR
jgi:hypothetical protein